MSDSQPPKQPPSSLKRKASTEVPPDYKRAADVDSTALPMDLHNAHAASVYEKAYAETTAEIKKLLRTYASSAAGAAGRAITPSDSTHTSTAHEYHNDVTHELEAILNDLANRPEMFEINEVKSVLGDCGIEIDVHQKGDGGKKVDVRLRMGE